MQLEGACKDHRVQINKVIPLVKREKMLQKRRNLNEILKLKDIYHEFPWEILVIFYLQN